MRVTKQTVIDALENAEDAAVKMSASLLLGKAIVLGLLYVARVLDEHEGGR